MGTSPSSRRAGPISGGRGGPISGASVGPIIWINPRYRNTFNIDGGRRRVRDTPAVIEERRSPTPPPTSTQLKVLSCGLKTRGNMFAHYTSDIDEVDGLVVRRGKAFKIELTLSRPYDDSTDDITLNFQTGETRNFQKRTRVLLSLREPRLSLAGGWKAEIEAQEKDELTVAIIASPDALVGKYSLEVRTTVKSGDSADPQRYILKEPKPVYLLFNAWCEADQVYMEDEKERKEYVLNERGFIWYGNWRQPGRRPWVFDQFEKGVFEAVMYLLEKHVDDYERGSSVSVSRVMSAAVNAQDDSGVLSGRWDGNYSPHARPTSWTGSKPILEKHFKDKAPVRYGQCWVFSGVFTTVLRCLGIPARSVTNYASAHDTDASMSIDRYYDQDNERLKEYESDSIWNFHVWNEAWMSRPELPAGYGGWQAVDATPQETSEGIYCAGPCSVNAIKQGHVYYPHDARFVFAEVNGDIVNWRLKKDRTTEVISIKTSHVGKLISTKAVGSSERQDLTMDYKHKEDTAAERAAIKAATSHGSNPGIYSSPEATEDVDIQLDFQDLFVGADFNIKVPMTNKSEEDRTVSITVIVQVVYYTGVLADKIKRIDDKKKLGPGLEHVFNFKIDADEYIDKMVDQSAFKVFLLGHVDETGQAFAEEDDFRLRTPDLDVKLLRPAASEVKVGEQVQVELGLKNPLKKTLTNCEISINGSGLLAPRVIKLMSLAAGGTLTETVEFIPRKAGERTLVATFESDQLSQVTGELDLTVLKSE